MASEDAEWAIGVPSVPGRGRGVGRRSQATDGRVRDCPVFVDRSNVQYDSITREEYSCLRFEVYWKPHST